MMLRYAESVGLRREDPQKIHPGTTPHLMGEEELKVVPKFESMFENYADMKNDEEGKTCIMVSAAWRRQFLCATSDYMFNLAEDTNPMTAIDWGCPWILDCESFADSLDAENCNKMKISMKSKWPDISVKIREYRKKYDERNQDLMDTLHQSAQTYPHIMAFQDRGWVFEALQSTYLIPEVSIICKVQLMRPECRDDPSCPAIRLACENDKVAVMAYYLIVHWFPFFNPADFTPAAKPTEDAWNLWEEFRKSAKARYFASYVDNIGGYDWSAPLACGCLQLCPLMKGDPMGGLELTNVCHYQESQVVRASLFPELTYPRSGEGAGDGYGVPFLPLKKSEWGKDS